MKKKIIFIVVCLLLLLSIIGYKVLDNILNTKIILDINPSIEMIINKDNKIKKVSALNEEGSKIINNLQNKNIKEALDILVNNVIDFGFASDKLDILLYSKNKKLNGEVKSELSSDLSKRDITSNIIVIDNVTKEDKKLAKKYDISISKAAYINSNVSIFDNAFESLVTKSVNEINEYKDRGLYCDQSYTLEGDFCVKEIGRTNTVEGDVCPQNYMEIDGVCYEEAKVIQTDFYTCKSDFVLKNDKCVRTVVTEATGDYKCDSGTLIKRGEAYRTYRDAGDYEEMTCADEANAQKPTLRCLTINHVILNGQCGVGPKPTINGGCLDGDRLISGGCYDFNTKDEYVCPSGDIYDTKDMICPDTITYSKATLISYNCNEGFVLSGNKCITEEIENAEKERLCPDGFTLTDNGRCVNYDNTIDFIKGYKCIQKNARVENNMCILLDIKNANKN